MRTIASGRLNPSGSPPTILLLNRDLIAVEIQPNCSRQRSRCWRPQCNQILTVIEPKFDCDPTGLRVRSNSSQILTQLRPKFRRCRMMPTGARVHEWELGQSYYAFHLIGRRIVFDHDARWMSNHVWERTMESPRRSSKYIYIYFKVLNYIRNNWSARGRVTTRKE